MTPETKTKIEKWCELAELNSDYFVKFFIYYMCLDSLMSDGAESEFDCDKKRWLISESPIIATWNDSEIVKSSVLKLAEIGVVRDERPTHNKKVKLTTSTSNNFSKVVGFIYQIRCNLFHGQKWSDRTKDIMLVGASYPILRDWVKRIIENSPNI